MITYPNQKVIHINKPQYTRDFLQVGITEWQEAYKLLTPTAFAIYLYLAGNMKGFNLALSQKAIEEALGIKKSSYHLAIKQLTELGFIVPIQGNIEAFFTTRTVQEIGQTQGIEVQKIGQESPENWTEQSKKLDTEVQKNDREIDKINNTYKTNTAKLHKEETKQEQAREEVEIKPEHMRTLVRYLEANNESAYNEYVGRATYLGSSSGEAGRIEVMKQVVSKYKINLSSIA